MNNKSVLLLGRGFFSLIKKHIDFVVPLDRDDKFLYEDNVFDTVSKGKTENIRLFDSSFIENNKNFDPKELFAFLMENIDFKYFNVSFENYNFNIEEAFESLDIENIINENKGKTLEQIFVKIKKQIAIFLSFLFGDKLEQINSNSKYSIDFYLDEILKNFDNQFNKKFFEWLDLQYKKIDFEINRFDLLKEPIIFKLSEDEDYLDVNKYDEKIVFSKDFKISKSKIYELYLKIEKSQLIKDIYYSKLRKYDDLYTLSEINLLKKLNVIPLSKINFDEKFGRFFNKLNIKNNNISDFDMDDYKTNFELLEYYPDLSKLTIIDSTNFDVNAFNYIFKNTFLKEIDFYLVDYENFEYFITVLKEISTKNNDIKVNIKNADTFIESLDEQSLEEIKNVKTLKYDLLWNQSRKLNHKVVYPIRLLKEIKGHQINDFGGFVSNPFNLSQLGDSWIEKNSLVLDQSRVIENAQIKETTIIKDSSLISGNSIISNSIISKLAMIQQNSIVNSSIVTDNAYVGKNTFLIGDKESHFIPNVKDNAKVEIEDGQINGRVVFKNNTKVKGIFNVENLSHKPMTFAGNSHIDGDFKAKGSISVVDNADIDGKVSLFDNSKVYGNAFLRGEISMFHNSKIYDNVRIGTEETSITLSGNAKIYENSQIYSSSFFSNDVEVYGNNILYPRMKFSGKTKFFANIHLNKLNNDIVFELVDHIFGVKWLKTFKKHELYEEILESIYIKNDERNNSKYVISNRSKSVWIPRLNKSITVNRIQALQDFGNVKKNEFGGYVENINNLSAQGKCWIYDNAIVFGNARVEDNAKVYNKAKIYDNAIISQNAIIMDNAKVYNFARVLGKSMIYNDTEICDLSIVSAMSNVSGLAKIGGNSIIFDNAKIIDNSIVIGSKINGSSLINSNALVKSSNIINSLISESKIKRSIITNSLINSNSKVINSNLDGTQISNSSFIRKSSLKNSIIRSNSSIVDSTVSWSYVSTSSSIDKSLVNWSTIVNNSNIDESTVLNSFIDSNSKISVSLVRDSKIEEFSRINQSIVEFSKTSWNVHLNNSKVSYSIISTSINIDDSIVADSLIDNKINIKNNYLSDYLLINNKNEI